MYITIDIFVRFPKQIAMKISRMLSSNYSDDARFQILISFEY